MGNTNAGGELLTKVSTRIVVFTTSGDLGFHLREFSPPSQHEEDTDGK